MREQDKIFMLGSFLDMYVMYLFFGAALLTRLDLCNVEGDYLVVFLLYF